MRVEQKVHAQGEQIGEMERGIKIYAPKCGATGVWKKIAKKKSDVTCKRCLNSL